jgi:EAL domain-containing protein (putative c-di-GMP-specific phosphodiesterase class I)/GGDEF domain-containing protein
MIRRSPVAHALQFFPRRREVFDFPLHQIGNVLAENEYRAMTKKTFDLSANALFQLRVGQAILAAQDSVKQVGLLLIAFDSSDNPWFELSAHASEFSEQMLTRLRSLLRSSDLAVRIDSEHMAVLLPSINDPEDAVLVANKISHQLQEPILLENLKLSAQPRIGIALYPLHSINATNLLHKANLALASAKRTGVNHVVYSEDLLPLDRVPLRMSDLRRAIASDQLFLLYQPKFRLEEGVVSGVEALVRWRHPELGIIFPDEFIPLAERTGLIIPMTLWVMHHALLQCREWIEAGFDVSTAVNLSMWNLESEALPEQIDGLLRSTAVPADKLQLEITESAIMVDPQRAMRVLTLIRSLGVSFSIDDFGTGYSSLAYLKKLPVACIKIDKSFVQHMERDRDNAVIVKSIIDLGHNLGLKVVAEGVETAAARDMLQELECDEAQGYFYSRPVAAHAITQLLAQPVTTARKKLAGAR